MSRWFSRLTLSCVAACSAFQAPHAWAQDEADKPTVVVTIAPLSKTLQDLSYVMRAAGVPEVSGTATMMVNAYSGGVDRNRPAGFALTMDENQTPVTVAYIPLTSREKFFEPLGSISEIDDLGDGLFAMNLGPQTVYALEKGEWLYVAQQEAFLEDVVADPTTVFGKSAERYDLSIRVDLESVPQQLKDMLLSQIKEGYERAMEQQSANQSEEERAVAEATGAQTIAQMEQMIKETSDVLIGWSVDQSGKKTHIDFVTQYVEGSEMEKQVAGLAKLNTQFGGFQANDAASSARFTSTVSERDVAQSMQALDTVWESALKEMEKKPETKPMAQHVKKFFDSQKSVIEATLKEGVIDGGMVVTLDDGLAMVAGGRVADGKKMAESVKELVSKVPAKEAPKVKFDAYKHQGVTFHTGTMPLPPDADDQARKIFGDEVKFVIGTGDKSFYVALGKDCETSLKSAIDKNASAKIDSPTPMEFHVELAQVLAYAQSIEPNPVVDVMLQKLKEFSGSDTVAMTVRAVPRGTMARITVEEGVLRAAGAAAKAGGGRQGGF